MDCKIEKFIVFSIQDNGKVIELQNALMMNRLLQLFGIELCKSVKTELAQGLNLGNDEPKPFGDATFFRQLVGSLLHLSSMVRPDIAFAVGYLSRHVHRPTRMTWRAGKHLVRYLSNTKERGVAYSGSEGGAVRAFNDADWGGERRTQKSVLGTLLIYAGATIYQRSRKQSPVTHSSEKGKLIALSFCVGAML